VLASAVGQGARRVRGVRASARPALALAPDAQASAAVRDHLHGVPGSEETEPASPAAECGSTHL
jgi:hypothetical protein